VSTTPDTPVVFITLAAICDQLGVSRNTVNAWRRDGRFPQGRRLPNGRVRYAVSDVESFIENLEAA
jgi:predicted DNA-binding transcriptional regulator AlpA